MNRLRTPNFAPAKKQATLQNPNDMFDNQSRTELSDLGEFGIIDHLTKHIKVEQPSTVKGIGDDAAVLDLTDGQTVITTDLLLEGVHFDLSYAPLKHLGYKAVTVNLSDVCAMNAMPRQITVSIGVSNRFSLEALEELYDGITLACERYNVDLVGGDTTTAVSGLTISITAIGTVKKDAAVYRNGAKEGNLVVVTGDLGGAYMGLQLLEREKRIFKENPSIQPDLEGRDYIVERQLKPEARVDVVQIFKDLKLQPTSMMDISDGLSSELMHICRQSGTGVELYEEKLPMDPMTVEVAGEFNMDPGMAALNGGEDYELLFTIDAADYDKVKNHMDFTVIGHLTDKASGYRLISSGGSAVPITAQGWDAMLKREEEEAQRKASENGSAE